MNKSIKFKFRPNSRDIKKVSEKSTEFLRLNGFSDQTVESQDIIIRELTRKGKNLANLGSSDIEMTLLLLIDKNTITVEIKKPIKESGNEQLDNLDKTIQWIRGYQDPFEPYMIKLREASDRPNEFDANGLELAKIAYKAGAILDFYVSEDNILNISAVRNYNEDPLN